MLSLRALSALQYLSFYKPIHDKNFKELTDQIERSSRKHKPKRQKQNGNNNNNNIQTNLEKNKHQILQSEEVLYKKEVIEGIIYELIKEWRTIKENDTQSKDILFSVIENLGSKFLDFASKKFREQKRVFSNKLEELNETEKKQLQECQKLNSKKHVQNSKVSQAFDYFTDMNISIEGIRNIIASINRFGSFSKVISLENLDLTEIDLSLLNLKHINFRNPIFDNTNLSGSSLSSSIVVSNLSGANLTDVTSFNATFLPGGIDLKIFKKNIQSSKKFSNIYFSQISFCEMEMSGTEFDGCVFDDVDMAVSSLRAAEFNNCRFKNVDLSGSNISKVKFVNCSFENVNFSSTLVYQTSVQNCMYQGIILFLNDVDYRKSFEPPADYQVTFLIDQIKKDIEKHNHNKMLEIIASKDELIKYFANEKDNQDQEDVKLELVPLNLIIKHAKVDFDFNGKKLRNIDFSSGFFLPYFNFENAELIKCKFNNYLNANFKHATIDDCNFEGAILENQIPNNIIRSFDNNSELRCSFENAEIIDSNFSFCRMNGVNANNSTWTNVSLKSAKISNSNFCSTVLKFINWENAIIDNFNDIKLDNSALSITASISEMKKRNIKINAEKINSFEDLSGLDFRNYNDQEVDIIVEKIKKLISKVDTVRNNIPLLKLKNTILTYNILKYFGSKQVQNLKKIYILFSEANFEHVEFPSQTSKPIGKSKSQASKKSKNQESQADEPLIHLKRRNISQANCRNMIFKNYDLSFCDATNTDFSGADFSGIINDNIINCNFTGAIFDNVTFGFDEAEIIRVVKLLYTSVINFPFNYIPEEYRQYYTPTLPALNSNPLTSNSSPSNFALFWSQPVQQTPEAASQPNNNNNDAALPSNNNNYNDVDLLDTGDSNVNLTAEEISEILNFD